MSCRTNSNKIWIKTTISLTKVTLKETQKSKGLEIKPTLSTRLKIWELCLPDSKGSVLYLRTTT